MSLFSRSGFIAALVLFSVILWTCPAASKQQTPPPTRLASESRALLPIVVGTDAAPKCREAASALSTYLERISGAAFAVEEGDGSSGIVLGLPGDFDALPFDVSFDGGPFGREEYLLRSRPDGLWLLGATPLAARHAAWDVLYRLGYRQFFPGETWEVVPSVEEPTLQVDTREAPDYYARRIWYNWGMRWGYNREPYRHWSARNRVVRGFMLRSGHAYGRIIRANRETFKKHPEYYALVDGERKNRGGNTKFCVANPGLRKLVVDWAVRHVKAHPDVDSISLEPSDGGGWCQGQACKEMGSPSDRALTLANDAAEAINDLGLGDIYVGMYAYNEHSPPPHIEVHPKVIISVATGFIKGGLSLKEIMEGWREKGATLGIYDYFSVVAWDWNMPRSARAARPHNLAGRIRLFHDRGARFLDAESGDAWGPYGPGYYVAGRVMWDIREAGRVEAIIDDFLTRAFGPAKEPMAEFYHLITQDSSRRSNADIVGRMYRHIQRARELVADHPRVLARLDDLTLYARYVELYSAFASATGKAKKEAKKTVLRHIYRMRESMMVHSYGLWARLIGQKAAHTKDHPLKDDRPFSKEDIERIIQQGIERNKPVERGFEPVDYSRDLVPAADSLSLREVQPGNFPPRAQDTQNYYIWVDEGTETVHLKIRVKKVWANKPHEVKLYAVSDGEPELVDSSGVVKPDGRLYDVKLETAHAGLHRVVTRDGGDYTHVTWPEGMPVCAPSAPDTPAVAHHFRGPWTLYFYVPEGTEVIGGWARRVASWAPRISGTLVSPDGQVRHDFSMVEDGWFSVDVPEGQDGKLWKFNKNRGVRLLMTVPPYLARTGKELLLPAEVVGADAAGN